VSSWPGGYQGGVTITNNGSSAINNWTLTWTYPSGTSQQITQMWGASYTQTGSAVSAVNASYDATIGASGGNVTFGFLANDGGQTTPPAAFFLNGNICSNN
jgi:cellulase/cellobiase CelA1